MKEVSSKPRFDRSIVEGPLRPAVWKIAWPTMLTNAIGGLQGMVDHALVGHEDRIAVERLRGLLDQPLSGRGRDEDGKGEIASLVLDGTTEKSSLTIAMKSKAAAGKDGEVSIGEITGTGSRCQS